MKTDAFHNFHRSVEGFANLGKVSKLKGGDGTVRQTLTIAGDDKGRQGFFEFIKDVTGEISHLFFRLIKK